MLEPSWEVIIRVAQALGARSIPVPADDPSRRQTCKVCGKADKFDFHVPNKIWNKVVPRRFRTRVVCLSCFDEFARQRNVDYAAAVDKLYFADDKATFTFQVVRAAELRAIPDSSGSFPSPCIRCRVPRSSVWMAVRHSFK